MGSGVTVELKTHVVAKAPNVQSLKNSSCIHLGRVFTEVVHFYYLTHYMFLCLLLLDCSVDLHLPSSELMVSYGTPYIWLHLLIVHQQLSQLCIYILYLHITCHKCYMQSQTLIVFEIVTFLKMLYLEHACLDNKTI